VVREAGSNAFLVGCGPTELTMARPSAPYGREGSSCQPSKPTRFAIGSPLRSEFIVFSVEDNTNIIVFARSDITFCDALLLPAISAERSSYTPVLKAYASKIIKYFRSIRRRGVYVEL
jgi:hypothetical protein